MSDPMTGGWLMDDLAAFRTALDNIELQAFQRMVEQYTVTFRASEIQFQDLVRQIQADIDAGIPFTVDRLRRMERYQQLMADTARRIDDYAVFSADETAALQLEAARRANADAMRLMEDALREDLVDYPTEVGFGALPDGIDLDDLTSVFHRLPEEAIGTVAGYAGNGTAIHEYFRNGTDTLPGLSEEVVQQLERVLTESVGLGMGSAKTARAFRDAMGIGLERAMTIARTETNRVYGLVNHASYMDNSDVVQGWRRVASLGPNCCAACVAEDGTEHPLTEVLNDHPNGACAAVPITILSQGKEPLRRIKQPDGSYTMERTTGPEWFEAQPDEVKRKVLGPSGFRAYQDGAVTLQDFSGTRFDPTFGISTQKNSLKAILGEEKAAQYYGNGAGKAAATAKGPSVPRFKTAADAAQWTKDSLGVDADYSSFSVEQSQAIADGLARVRNDYLGDFPIDRVAPMALDTTRGGGAMAAFEHFDNTRTVFVNERRFVQEALDAPGEEVAKWKARLSKWEARIGSPDWDNDYVAERVETYRQTYLDTLNRPRWNVGDTLDDIIVHEMGHAVEDSLQQGEWPDISDWLAPSELRARELSWHDTVPAHLESVVRSPEALRLSEYASTNSVEYFAEAFVAYSKGQTEKIDSRLLGVFKRIMQ